MEQTNEKKNYRPDIDGLRAVAIIAVVIYHAFPAFLPGGFTGVDIFFVISGYLITKIIYQQIAENRFSFYEFYIRRIRRLFPALIVMLGACLLYGWIVLLPIEYEQLGKHVAASSICIQNFVFWKESGYFDGGAYLKPLLNLWSLAVEEQFYILFPPLLLLLCKFRGFAINALIIIAIASFVANVVMSYQNRASDFFITTYRAWELLVGCILSILHLNRGDINKSISQSISIIGCIFILMGFYFIDENDPFPGWRAIFPVFGAACLIHAGLSSSLNKNILSNSWVVWVGLISYPLYLFHWPIISFIHIIEAGDPTTLQLWYGIGLSIILSIITYYFVENKLRHNKARWVTPSLVIGFLALGVLGYAVFRKIVLPAHNTKLVEQVSAAVKDNGIQDGFEIYPGTQYGKIKKVGGDGRQTVFLGDSHIQQYAPRIKVLLNDASPESRGAIFTAAPASLPIQGLITHGWNNGEDLMKSFWEKLSNNAKVDRVVIGARWEGSFHDNTEYKGISFRDADFLPTIMHELKNTVKILKSMGKKVYLLLDTPTGAELDPKNLSIRGYTSSNTSGVRRMRVNDFLNRDQAIRQELLAIANEAGAEVIDPIPFLSDGEYIISSNEDGPIRCDDSHLRPGFVRDHVKYLDRTVAD